MREQCRLPGDFIPPVRLVAFYLPQFHPIPENDLWWGKGFTEWDNVRGARPLYAGHAQPNAPHPLLGCYDLRDIRVMRRQIRLARQHGIFGFCFHHYWFEGKRLLERPVEAFLSGADDPGLSLPFCLHWANHNWARTWTGDPTILLEQRHSPEDDIAFMRDALRHFRDPRYIRIRGRPLLLIFRADGFADPKATRERWGQVCAEHGEAQPWCAMLQTYRNFDPRLFHMDAAVQFPPHAPWLPDNKYPLRAVPDPAPGFHGYVVDYEDLARLHLEQLKAGFTLFPGLVPAWDNSPRRGVKASVFADSSPEKYSRWLARSCEHVARRSPEERLVFINAWNEWGESACLEPDARNGFAYLNATSAVLQKLGRGAQLPESLCRQPSET
ncbi:MAG: glycoside hydrolase family 99-like domain-containing protein [Deltaproteobacteria bacterium]|jgi:lipopolysaccharide biosynthesis protein|nr:glycoside hydrolase family 99-like domain-containing protein [Deltaproteobacteria bacterium]